MPLIVHQRAANNNGERMKRWIPALLSCGIAFAALAQAPARPQIETTKDEGTEGV